MDTLDEALERLHATGTEFGGFLSNHGPMVVEALHHHGLDGAIHPWLDWYTPRLEPRPAAAAPVDDWRTALGNRQVAAWTARLEREMTDAPWRGVLATWWPRLLPGIAGAATHGTIRVGHAVRALRERESAPRRRELAIALGYWAAMFQPMPVAAPRGMRPAPAAVAALPLAPDRTGGATNRLRQLGATPGWLDALAARDAVVEPERAHDHLRSTIAAATGRYLTHGHGMGIMLVHSVTAPTAVLRVLPDLPPDQWVASAELAWAASAALVAAYGPDRACLTDPAPWTRDDLLAAAVAHRDEHVIKLVDAVLDVHAWSGDPLALAAGARSLDLIAGNVRV